jgi:hypothetical protein
MLSANNVKREYSNGQQAYEKINRSNVKLIAQM